MPTQTNYSKRNLLLLLLLVSGLAIALTSIFQVSASDDADDVTEAAVSAEPYQPIITLPNVDVPSNTTSQTDAEQSIITPATADVSAVEGGHCRYGVAELGGTEDAPFINEMDAGWKVNFNVNFATAINDSARYTPIVRFKPVDSNEDGTPDTYRINGPQPNDDVGQLGSRVLANPGRIWLLGNEVDRRDFQDSLPPAIYARAYHDIYHFIKDRDPTAQIAISGLVLISPGRLQYLDLVLAAYEARYGTQMPVDVWNAHLYVLPERKWDFPTEGAEGGIAIGTDFNLAIFNSSNQAHLCSRDDVHCYSEHDNVNLLREQIFDMRSWMDSKGEGDKPLIISEYGLLYPYIIDDPNDPNACFLKDENGQCFTPARSETFMRNSFDMLESYTDPSLGYSLDNNRMVQQWLWFATRDESGNFPYTLVEPSGSALSNMGRTFRDYVANQPRTVNLMALSPTSVGVQTGPDGTASAELKFIIRNNGTTAALGGFDVTFYSDSTLTTPIGTVTIDEFVGGCATDVHHVSFTWSGLTEGTHRYWARVNSGNSIGETNNSDNVVTGIVFVDQPTVYLPFLSK